MSERVTAEGKFRWRVVVEVDYDGVRCDVDVRRRDAVMDLIDAADRPLHWHSHLPGGGTLGPALMEACGAKNIKMPKAPGQA